MNQQPENFWPSDLPDPADPIPVALLKEQAELLAVKTGGEIKGLVKVSVQDNRVFHTLYLSVESLGDYLYEVLHISHEVENSPGEIYPIFADGLSLDSSGYLDDDASFRSWLRAQLSSERVRSLLGNLKGYIRDSRSVQVG